MNAVVRFLKILRKNYLIEHAARLERRGEGEKAAEIAARAQEFIRRNFGERSPGVAESLDIMARQAWAVDDLAYADLVLGRALEVRRATLGHRHPLTAEALVR